jgi:hypothetical protein
LLDILHALNVFAMTNAVCCIHNIRFLLLAGLFAAIGAVPAQAQSIFDQLYRDGEVLRISIETDLDALINERPGEEAVPATFVYTAANKQKLTEEIKVSARGKFRRRVCGFPPVRLNFSKSSLRQQGLSPKFDKLKLVTHCLDDRSASQDNVLKEYLIYKLYNELTPYSLRAQLVRVDYIDSQKNLPRIRRYGIILEDPDELALRMGGKECKECYNLGEEQIDAGLENLMCVFQYMIGNTDWSLAMVRNIKLIERADGIVVPVPFDFDFAGFVNASYALPNADYGLLSTKQRAFLGRESTWSAMAPTLEAFAEKKAVFLQIIRRARLLSYDGRTECTAYLESFYREIEALLDSDGAGFPGPLQSRLMMEELGEGG